jgi:hypothetical protein
MIESAKILLQAGRDIKSIAQDAVINLQTELQWQISHSSVLIMLSSTC